MSHKKNIILPYNDNQNYRVVVPCRTRENLFITFCRYPCNEINIKYALNRGKVEGNKDCNQCIRDVTTVNLSLSLSPRPKARHATFRKGRLIQIKIQFEAVSLSSIPVSLSLPSAPAWPRRREGGGPLVML